MTLLPRGARGWWGPVFAAEQVTHARRWQGYVVRSGFVAVLLLGLVVVWGGQTRGIGQVSVQEMAAIGAAAYQTLTTLELAMVLAIAPVATAGAICIDRSRGTLDHVFVTDLSDREIILGKLAARLVPVWGLLACTFPVAALSTWLGGIDPRALLGAGLVTAGVAFLGCTLPLMLSVRASQPHEVLTVVFAVWAVWLLAFPVTDLIGNFGLSIPFALTVTNPFTLMRLPYTQPGQSGLVEPALFALACLAIGTVCTSRAIREVRTAGSRTSPARPRAIHRAIGAQLGKLAAWMPHRRGPTLDPDPILWREWHRNRPARWSRWVWVGFRAVSDLAGVTLALVVVAGQPRGPRAEMPPVLIAALTCLGLLLISTGAAAVLAEERARGSLDVLLCTPISTRSILWAKWRGAFRRVPRLMVWPAVVGVLGSFQSDFGLAALAIGVLVPVLVLLQGAALVSLGLALATWIKRTGLATAVTVGAYVVALVGWPMLNAFSQASGLTRGPAGPGTGGVILEWGLSMGSTFFNTGLALAVAIGNGPTQTGDRAGILLLVVIWSVIYAGAAWLLFEATVRTFDRSLGRTPEQRRPR